MDRDDWDARYAGQQLVWSAEPNRFLVAEIGDSSPGRALDLGCGEGRNAIWLAEQGWTVTGVDFSKVALDKARRLAAARHVSVAWELADLNAYTPPDEQFDLVIVMYLHLVAEPRHVVFGRAAAAVAPGGTLLVVGHDLTNLDAGWGGPRDPSVLYGPDDVVTDVDWARHRQGDPRRASRHDGRGRQDRHRRSRTRHATTAEASMTTQLPLALVGDDVEVPCVDGRPRRYVNLDGAASTNALPAVATRVHDFVPWYSSVHRGAGYKSRTATDAYERARAAIVRFAARAEAGQDVAIICRNTTEAINHLAYRLRLNPDDIVVTTVIEHHANLLPWARVARRRFVECAPDGTFTVDDVVAALDAPPRPKLLAISGASNVTGWMPPLEPIAEAARARGIPVFVDAAQLAPHRPIPSTVDYVAWSGHKMYAPFGAGALVGPRHAFADGDPFLAGGGAVDLVDLDEVVWTDPPEREEAGSPNVIGAVALHAAIDEFERIGWAPIERHDDELATQLRSGLAAIPGVTVLGPGPATPTLPIATFTVEGVHHSLVAARLSAEHGIGVRHGCFCAHPYLLRLLHLSDEQVRLYREAVLRGDRRRMPGAVRASATIATSQADIDLLLDAVTTIANGSPAPVSYQQDEHTGDFWPDNATPGWTAADRAVGASCARG